MAHRAWRGVCFVCDEAVVRLCLKLSFRMAIFACQGGGCCEGIFAGVCIYAARMTVQRYALMAVCATEETMDSTLEVLLIHKDGHLLFALERLCEIRRRMAAHARA